MSIIKFNERRRARFHAVQALYQQSLENSTVEKLKLQFYDSNVNRYNVEWIFFYRLIDGVYKNKLLINKKIDNHAIRSLNSINMVDLAILQLGTYELIDCLEIPYQVVLNEYINQSKELGTKESYRFVNGMLGKISKEVRKCS